MRYMNTEVEKFQTLNQLWYLKYLPLSDELMIHINIGLQKKEKENFWNSNQVFLSKLIPQTDFFQF